MNYVIRKKEKRDCADIAHIVTIAWNETYKGIVSEEFLNGLYNNEDQRVINSSDDFDEDNNHQKSCLSLDLRKMVILLTED